MKANYSYKAAWFHKKDEQGRTPFGGYVDGIALVDDKDLMGVVFRQHPEILSASKVKLVYVELAH